MVRKSTEEIKRGNLIFDICENDIFTFEYIHSHLKNRTPTSWVKPHPISNLPLIPSTLLRSKNCSTMYRLCTGGTDYVNPLLSCDISKLGPTRKIERICKGKWLKNSQNFHLIRLFLSHWVFQIPQKWFWRHILWISRSMPRVFWKFWFFEKWQPI